MTLPALAPGFDYDEYRSRWSPAQWAEWSLGDIKTGTQSGMGRTLVFDTEADGLFHAQKGKNGKPPIKEATQFWCVAAEDLDTHEQFYWGVDLGPDSLRQAWKFFSECECLIGHNSIGFDFPTMEKLVPDWKRPAKAWDSMVMAKVVEPGELLIEKDMDLFRAGKLPGFMVKSQSLKAWGIRTGTHKTDYAGGFEEWCPAMATYLMDDVAATVVLWRRILRQMGWAEHKPGGLIWQELTVQTECDVARIIFEQEERGVRFDNDRALALVSELLNEEARITEGLGQLFGSWWQPLGNPKVAKATVERKLPQHPDVIIPRFGKNGKALRPYVGPPKEEVVAGSQYTSVEYTTFKPSSRDHLGDRLQKVYGWKPKAFGANGKPTVDETTLEAIPDSVLPPADRQLILDYFVVSKTLGTLSRGAKAWTTMARQPEEWMTDGRIHGHMDTCGAITRRGTHSSPNLSGTPSVEMEKDEHGTEHPITGLRGHYGWECRELFTCDVGEELTGVDASSLELIDLGHYLAPLDGGAFSRRVCDPDRDPHREHAEIMGKGTLRKEAKTGIYLKIYGGSAYKHSLALDVEPSEIVGYLGYRGLHGLLSALGKRYDEDFVSKLDDRQKALIAKARIQLMALEKGITGLKALTEMITAKAQDQKWLKAIDGSRIWVRKAHAALNALLQSAGAITCKMWMVEVHAEMKRRGYVHGVDYKQLLWVHDELQFSHKVGLGPVITEVAEAALVKVGELLGLRGRYRTSGKTGLNWASCH